MENFSDNEMQDPGPDDELSALRRLSVHVERARDMPCDAVLLDRPELDRAVTYAGLRTANWPDRPWIAERERELLSWNSFADERDELGLVDPLDTEDRVEIPVAPGLLESELDEDGVQAFVASEGRSFGGVVPGAAASSDRRDDEAARHVGRLVTVLLGWTEDEATAPGTELQLALSDALAERAEHSLCRGGSLGSAARDLQLARERLRAAMDADPLQPFLPARRAQLSHLDVLVQPEIGPDTVPLALRACADWGDALRSRSVAPTALDRVLFVAGWLTLAVQGHGGLVLRRSARLALAELREAAQVFLAGARRTGDDSFALLQLDWLQAGVCVDPADPEPLREAHGRAVAEAARRPLPVFERALQRAFEALRDGNDAPGLASLGGQLVRLEAAGASDDRIDGGLVCAETLSAIVYELRGAGLLGEAADLVRPAISAYRRYRSYAGAAAVSYLRPALAQAVVVRLEMMLDRGQLGFVQRELERARTRDELGLDRPSGVDPSLGARVAILQGEVAERAGDPELAEAHYRYAVEVAPKAMTDLRFAWSRLAELARGRAEWNRAAAHLDAALQHVESVGDVATGELAMLLQDRLELAELLGEVERARELRARLETEADH